MKTIPDVIRWLEQAPGDTLLPARSVLEMLRDATPGEAPQAHTEQPLTTWRERLWTVPPETRLGVAELSEAIGRPKSWVYRHCSRASGYELLPHRKLDNELTFVASEIRDWLRAHESAVVAPISSVLTITRSRRQG